MTDVEPTVAGEPRAEGPGETGRRRSDKPDARKADARQGENPLRGSRTSGFWAAVVALGVVLVLLIIFIAQNTRQTTMSFLGWDGQMPVAVAVLIAFVAGLFLASVAGSLRILQLRRRIRRQL